MQVYESMPLCLIMSHYVQDLKIFEVFSLLPGTVCEVHRFRGEALVCLEECQAGIWQSTGDHRSLAVKIWTQSIQFHRPRLCFLRRAHLQLYTAFSLHQGGSPHHSFTYFYSFWHVITVLRQLLLVITPLTFLYWPGTIYFTFLAESLLWLFALEIQLCQPLPSLFQR